LIIVTLAVVALRSRIAHDSINSIAVLPFTNVSGDPDAEYLSDGIAETLINDLSEIQRLRVIPRASVFRFKGKTDFHEAAAKLHVRAVVMGRVLRRGNTLDIQAELIDADNDRQLWGGQYQKRMADLVNIQSEIGRDVANHLRLQMSYEERQRMTGRSTASPQAYEAYLRGRYFWNKRTVDGLRKSLEYFQKAIDIDPTYALAYSGLSDGYGLLGTHYFGGMPPTQAMPRAKAAALKALDLDPDLGEAHSSLAWVLAHYDWNLSASEAEFRRAIGLNPKYPTAHQWLAITLAYEQKYDDAVAEMMKAHELDPLSAVITYQVGWMYYFARRYPEAEQRLVQARDLDPSFTRTYLILSLTHLAMNKPEQAVADAQDLMRLSNGLIQRMYLARAYALDGNRREAIAILDAVLHDSKRRYLPPYYIAILHAALGDRDGAFTYLDKSFDEHSSAMMLLHIEPTLDSIRSDPRFQGLLRRVAQTAR
jgi:TolB-like protein/Tfp pilus assembly protein PilF